MAAAAASSSSTAPPVTAARRLARDLQVLEKSANPQIKVRPSENNVLEWHFVLHSLPSDTPYKGGCYHGKISFPQEYPHMPPALVMVTPSGRLATARKLCLSMTDFHPESWNPAWSVETILVGLLSYFVSDAERGYGSVSAPAEKRQQMADDSWAFNARDAEFRTLFPEFVEPPTQLAGSVLATSADSGDAAEEAHTTAALGRAEPDTAGEESSGESTARSLKAPGLQGASEAGGPAQEEGAEMQARSTVSSEDSSDTGAPECWICRDTSSPEPLIQPCACTGSMSGVHASCVEQWIRHHRRSAVNDEVPRCSVCHQPYRGYERRPGVYGFLRHVCCDAFQQLVRTIVLVVMLVAYQDASLGDESGLPLVPRIGIIVGFGLACACKVIVLTVSLPPHRPPPQNRWLRAFFTADYRSLAMHIAEAVATTSVLSFWCACQSLRWPYLVPLLALASIPLGKMMLRHPSVACVRRAAAAIFAVVLSPILVLGTLAFLVLRYPRRAIHPLDAGIHIAVALTSVGFLFCESNVPVISLWAVHSVVLAAGLLEQLVVKRLRWHDGPLWWFALQISGIAAYLAMVIADFPKGIGQHLPDTNTVVHLVSAVWFALLLFLTLCTNWSLCVRQYRTWQHRHGTFTLQRDSDGTAGADLERGATSVVPAT